MEHGRERLNSAYAVLASVRHIQCRNQKAMFSTYMAPDMEIISIDIRDERWKPLISSLAFEFPGSQEVSSDV